MNYGSSKSVRAYGVLVVSFALVMPIAFVMNLISEGAEGETDDVLRIGFLAKVDSMNPNIGLVDAAYIFYGLVYDTPHCLDEDLNIIGNLCTDWYVDEDYEPYGSAWIMEFTDNAKWHDGERLTADDVVFTFNLNCQNYVTMWAYQPYAYYMNYSEKIDDYTVRVHYFDRATEDPMPAAYARMICIPILPEHMLKEWSPTDIAFDWEGVFHGYDPPIVGTGPFMASEDIYEEFLDGNILTFERNPYYHWQMDKEGNPEIHFDRLEMHFFNDATAMAIALENGDIDVAQFPPHEYHTIKGKVESGQLRDVVAHNSPKCTQYWSEANFNMNNAGPNPSRLDPVIRRALTMATDLEHINSNYYLGYGEPGTTMIPPVNEEWHYEPTEEELYEYDLVAAAALLEAGGYRYTPESPDVRVCTADSYAVQQNLIDEGTPLSYHVGVRQEAPEEKDIVMFLQNEWAKIGVDIYFDIMTEAALGTLTYGYMYDITVWYWSADIDPMYMLFCQSWVSWGGWSDNKYYNPAYEENFTLSVQEFDVEKRREYVHNCQRIHYNDAVYIILNYVDQTYAWRTDTFTGWGDWEAHPGRSVDNFWTGNPLYFDLVPGEAKSTDVPWPAVIAGVVVVSAAIAATVFLRRRRAKGQRTETRDKGPLGE
ncbi:MAG: ABC transporter substrate-binding protein [Methanobacteriota archaeon]|nr:MAG: ABC transporter substrate-binding protein [Euryarchaeota archaeon]